MARVVTYSLNPALDLAIQLDALHPGEVNRAGATRLDAAGKGINVARVLLSLGHEVRVGGFLGADNQAPFQHAFAAAGLHDLFVRIPGETRINAKLSERDGRVTDLNGPGTQVTAEAWVELLEGLPWQLAGVDAVVVAGSLPRGVSTAQFDAFLARLHAQGKPVWLDTSGAGLASARHGTVDLLKPNEHELAELVGRPLPDAAAQLAAARQLVDAGRPAQLLLSLGADGAYWLDAAEAWQALPPKVEVVSTVCAGDTLLAAMLHGQLEGWSRERSLRHAVALAAECVRHVGPGNPHAEDFEQLCAQTRVQPADVARSVAVEAL
ncbi:1-phosphofructokinase [Frateuria defendens]|uniref:1-phosphofructokinase n=1 Tax=Frateuria defendens TaxID=2219559 RepID=UPI00066FEAC4|nr:1-phosphofructokinase [Frateuria defendens]